LQRWREIAAAIPRHRCNSFRNDRQRLVKWSHIHHNTRFFSCQPLPNPVSV